MHTSDLTVSAIIPVYNGWPYVEHAIRSVLQQSRPAAELILIDDGSSDGSADLIRRTFPDQTFQIVAQPNAGQSAARNHGVRLSRGTHIALLDQDDVWYPDHLERLAEPFLEARAIPLGWTYSNLDEIDAAGALVVRSMLDEMGSAHPKRDIAACLRENMFVLPSASLIARTAFDAVGGFDPRLSGYEDDDLFLRLFRAGYDNEFIDAALSQWRIYPASTSYSPRMARSRRIYFDKLAAAFPDDARRHRFQTSRQIAPRFHRDMADELRRAMRSGDPDAIAMARRDLEAVRRWLPAPRLERLDPQTMLVSAIIALRNQAGDIEATVASALAQTHPPDEVIVVDDDSTDGGPAIVERLAVLHPVRLLRQDKAGPSAARSQGLAASSGDLIALLEPGDAWHPNHIEALMQPFLRERAREVGWAYGNIDAIDADGRVVASSHLPPPGPHHPKRDLLACLREDMAIPPSAALISRQAIAAVGGYDPALSGYADEDLFLRLFRAGYDNEYIYSPLARCRVDRPNARDDAGDYARTLLTQHPTAATAIAARFLRAGAIEVRRALGRADPVAAAAARQSLEAVRRQLPAAVERMDRQTALVAAIIPMRDAAGLIEAALASVFAQTRPPDEVIVVDDGSADEGPAIVQRLSAERPITLLRQARAGLAAARNRGVAHCACDLIALLDPDDAWRPTHIEALLEPFGRERARELGWAYSNVDADDGAGVVVSPYLSTLGAQHPKRDLLACVREDMHVMPSAAIVSRRALEAVGGFDETLAAFEDDDLFLRLFRAGYANDYIDTPLTRWRIRHASPAHAEARRAGRIAYARKLMQAFPDDAARGQFMTSQAIAPRFEADLADEVRRAIAAGDPGDVAAARRDLDEVRRSPGAGRLDQRLVIVAAVIPLYNGAATIAAALDSVFAQTRPADQVIVVDDGSTDDGAAIVERMAAALHGHGRRISLISQANAGQSAARNRGVAASVGDVIAFLDQDDSWRPDHIDALLGPFLVGRARELGWTYSNVDEMDGDGHVVVASFLSTLGTQHPKRDVLACIREDMYVLPSAALVSRRAFDAVGGFDPALSGYEDDDLFLRLFRAGYDNEYIDAPLSRWRMSRTSASHTERMGDSRIAYARKLLAEFPDDPVRGRLYTRDLLLPRFFPHGVAEYLKARAAGDAALTASRQRELALFTGHLNMRQSLALRVVQSPAMGRGPLPRLARRAARTMRGRLRRLLQM